VGQKHVYSCQLEDRESSAKGELSKGLTVESFTPDETPIGFGQEQCKGDNMSKVTTSHAAANRSRKCRPVNSQEVGEDGTNQPSRLRKCLVEVTPGNLIACCKCRTIADVSVTGTRMKLICPRCYETLGSWATTSEAIADMTAFVASSRAGE
jgi:hypothetical protein